MINLAIGRGCDSKIVNYLLSRKVSATERLTSQGYASAYVLDIARKAHSL